MKLTSQDMLKLELIDGVIKEPVGGAHSDPEKAFENVKTAIVDSLNELRDVEPQKRVATRIKKFSSMGHYEEA
jgi:acetyl-CoA carboxylase carboxyl transferase subunit alpha